MIELEVRARVKVKISLVSLQKIREDNKHHLNNILNLTQGLLEEIPLPRVDNHTTTIAQQTQGQGLILVTPLIMAPQVVILIALAMVAAQTMAVVHTAQIARTTVAIQPMATVQVKAEAQVKLALVQVMAKVAVQATPPALATTAIMLLMAEAALAPRRMTKIELTLVGVMVLVQSGTAKIY